MTFLYFFLILFLLMFLVEVVIPYLLYRFFTRLYLAFKVAELKCNIERVHAAQILMAKKDPNYVAGFMAQYVELEE